MVSVTAAPSSSAHSPDRLLLFFELHVLGIIWEVEVGVWGLSPTLSTLFF